MFSLKRFYRLLTGTGAALLLVLAFVFPLHLPPWTTFHNELIFAAAIVLLVSNHLDHVPRIDAAFHTSCAAVLAMTG